MQDEAQRLFEESGRPPVAIHVGPVAARRLLAELRTYLASDELPAGAVARFGELDVYEWEDAPPFMATVSDSRVPSY